MIKVEINENCINFNSLSIKLCNLKFGAVYSETLGGELINIIFDTFVTEERISDRGLISGKEYVLTGTCRGMQMKLYILPAKIEDVIHLAADVTNMTGGNVYLWTISLLEGNGIEGGILNFDGNVREYSFLAFDTYNIAGVQEISEKKEAINKFLKDLWSSMGVKWYRAKDVIYDEPNWCISKDFGGIFKKNTQLGMFAGFYGPGQAYGDICVKSFNGIEGIAVRSRMEGVLLEPMEMRSSENALLISGNPQYASTIWAEFAGTALGARKKFEPLTGWCSWYRKGPNITEEGIYKTIDEFSGLKKKVDLIQIDDGFEKTVGDWEADPVKFPSGMKAVADKIKEAGFMPGIYLAPTAVQEESPVYLEHKDWIQRLPDGTPSVIFKNWGGESYFLDVTIPEVKEYISGLVKQQIHEWGYKYIKFDFVYPITPEALFHDPKKTSFQMLRELYRIFREAAGDDVYILACEGTPGRHAVGYADACRIGPDCGYKWDSMQEAMYCTILSLCVNKKWFWNDPDVIYMRGNNIEVPFEERRFCATVAALNGGLTLTSDLPSEWDSEGMNTFFKLIPASGVSAIPCDLNRGEMPRIFLTSNSDNTGTYTAITTLKWKEDEDDIIFDFKELGLDIGAKYHVFEFWTASYKGIIKDKYQCCEQPVHSARVYIIRPVTEGIQLIADSVHVYSRIESYNIDFKKLRVHYNSISDHLLEVLYVYSTEKLQVIEHKNCKINSVLQAENSLWQVSFTPSNGEVDITVG